MSLLPFRGPGKAAKAAAFLVSFSISLSPCSAAVAQELTGPDILPSAPITSQVETNVAPSEIATEPSVPDKSLSNESAPSDEVPVPEGTSEEKILLPDDGAQSSSLLSSSSDSPSIMTPNLFSYKSLQPSVEGSTGALKQKIVLDIPPGRNGMQPDLALEYNSQNTEEGLVGYGWTISIPYIQVINKTGSQNLYRQPVYSSSLEGELATTSTSTYRARVTSGQYEYLFSSNTWTVYDKKGTRYLFGSADQSRQQSSTTPALTSKWMLEEIRDTNDNYVRYVYAKDENQLYPSQIIYTGHTSTDGPFVITFSTSTRPGPVIGYRSGFRIVTNYRISQITASIDGNWIRKYDLSYITGNNGYRSLLSSVQQSGRDENWTTFSYPATTFDYVSTSTPYVSPHSTTNVENASYVVADASGRGLNDVTISGYASGINGQITHATTVTTFNAFPEYWANNSAGARPLERGVRFLDLNADGKADIVRGHDDAVTPTSTYKIYINNYATSTGYSWVASTTYPGTIPTIGRFYSLGGSVAAQSMGIFGDVNADGLPDYELAENGQAKGAYLGNGSAWDTSTTTIFFPAMELPNTSGAPMNYSQLVDINADGLDDWVYSDATTTYVLMNNGTGWDVSPESRWTIATTTFYAATPSGYYDRGMRFLDINGDGLPDFVRAYNVPSHVPCSGIPAMEVASVKTVFLNTGSGWATSTAYTLPSYITYISPQSGTCTWTGDIYHNEYANWTGNGQMAQDVMSKITYSRGGSTDVIYTPTAQQGTHPELPTSILTVTKLVTHDARGTDTEISYSYSGGKLYLAQGPRERKFAGFYSVAETRPDSIVTSYFNQADWTNTAAGEQTDGYSLMNRIFKQTMQAPSNGATLKNKFFRWDQYSQGNAMFVGLGRTLEQSYALDGSHFDKATSYTYATSTGDLLETNEYGEVTGNSDGTFTDAVITDSRITSYSYATSTNNISVLINKKISSLDFIATTSIASSTTASYSYLLIGGGGGGGGSWGNAGGAGGGAGGMQTGSGTLSFPGTYSVIVGPGGSGSGGNPSSNGAKGATSTFNGVSVSGGGGGAYSTGSTGSPGGSGGGGWTTNAGGTGISGQGNNGASGSGAGCNEGGGGGGAGAAGSTSGTGGNGAASSITGSSVTYAGGGGTGGANCGNSAGGTGGTGGGGTGGSGSGSGTGSDGTDGLGGGGGGGKDGGGGGSGGDGVVIISVPTASLSAYTVSGGTRTTSGTNAIFTFASSDTWTVSGTTTSTSTALTKAADEKYLYDNLSYGSVSLGNQTQIQNWITGATYASSTKTYNSYGLATQISDTKGNATTLSYDTENLYPVTVTNALSQATAYTYDYPTGNVHQSTDPNSAIQKTVRDGLGRIVSLYQSDLSTPATLVKKRDYAYSDSTTTPSSIHITDYLNAASTTDSYTYFDGLDRAIQERKSSDESGISSVVDKAYNTAGLLYSVSLPYKSSGTLLTTGTTSAPLYSYFTYDPLQRVTHIQNAVGSTTSLYGASTITLTDANSKVKKIYNDAYDNLIRVDEAMGTSTFVTTYDYDKISNLTKITDAEGNIRNFTYDGLGRRKAAEDLHAFGDASYGVWNYTYDPAGNLTSWTNPNGQIINRTYDALSRLTSEDFTGNAGTEQIHTYDSCANGIGRLCAASSTVATISYAYDVLGRTIAATTTIDGTPYGMAYAFDRLGNVETLTHPDSTQLQYLYNQAGQVGSIQKKRLVDMSWNPVAVFSAYSPTGHVASTTFANGIFTVNAYDPSSLYRLANKKAGNSVAFSTTTGSFIQNLSYLYDPAGNITHIANDATDSSQWNVYYEYDDLNRLLAAKPYVIGEADSAAIHVLLVGGGGGGGGSHGGGGGGGGRFVENSALTINVGSYAVAVGAGGSGGVEGSSAATNGGASSIGTIAIADGGGRGGGAPSDALEVPNTGGSGGGAQGYGGPAVSGAAASAGSSTGGETPNGTGFGSGGGSRTGGLVYGSGAGGGGAGGAGADTAGTGSPGSSGGAGGVGKSSSITGSAVYYAGGGGGGSWGGTGGAGGNGGGGNGANGGGGAGGNGTANTGGGGGGSRGNPNPGRNGGTGGSGVVIIAYPTGSIIATGGATSTAGGNTIHTFTAGGTFQVTAIITSVATATSTETYSYNSLGNLLTKRSGTATSTYQYAQTSYANPHAATQVSTGNATTSYTYDNGGNVLTAGPWSYTWDYLNRMASASNGVSTSTYAYDPSGQRIKQTVNGVVTIYPSKSYSIVSRSIGTTTYATTTDYIWSGDTLVSYIDQALMNGVATGTPQTYYVHPDHLGSTNVVTNASSTVVQTLDYYPYGGSRVNSGTGGTDSARKYIGQFTDSSGLDYLNARYYEANRGQFLSQDPTFLAIGNPSQLQNLTRLDQQRFLADPQQMNSYSYARGNPITNKDPDGNFAPAIAYAAWTAPEWVPAVLWGIGAAGAYITADMALRNNGNTWGSRWAGTVPTVDLTRGSGLNQNPMGPEDWDPKNFGNVPTWMKALTIGGFVAGGIKEFGEPIYEMYQSLTNRGPQAAQQLNQQFNSSSVQSRVQATQTYNAATGASSPQQQLWVTPNGAVINWGGGVVAPAPQTSKK